MVRASVLKCAANLSLGVDVLIQEGLALRIPPPGRGVPAMPVIGSERKRKELSEAAVTNYLDNAPPEQVQGKRVRHTASIA